MILIFLILNSFFGLLAAENKKFCEWKIVLPLEKIVKEGHFLVRKTNCNKDAKFVFQLMDPNLIDQKLWGTEVKAKEVPQNTDSDFVLLQLEGSLKSNGSYSVFFEGEKNPISKVKCCDSKVYQAEDIKKLFKEMVDEVEKKESETYWGKYYQKFQTVFPEVTQCFFEDCLGLSLKNAQSLGFNQFPEGKVEEKEEGSFKEVAFPKVVELKPHFLNEKKIKYYSRVLKSKYPYQTKERGVILHRDFHSNEVEIRSRLHFIDRFIPACGIATDIKTLKNSETYILRFLDRFGVKYDNENVKRLIKTKKEFGLPEVFKVSKKRTNKNRSKLKIRRMEKDSFRISFSSSLCGPL